MCKYFAFFLTALPMLCFFSIDKSPLYASLTEQKNGQEFFTGILDGDTNSEKEIVILRMSNLRKRQETP